MGPNRKTPTPWKYEHNKDQHVGYNSSITLKLFRIKDGQNTIQTRAESRNKNDNMTSSTHVQPTATVLFTSGSKRHMGGGWTEMQHTNRGQYNTEQNVRLTNRDMKTKSYSIKCVEWAKSADLSVQMIFGAKENLACSMNHPPSLTPRKQSTTPERRHPFFFVVFFFKYDVAMQFKMSPRCIHLFNITQLLI